MKPVELSPAAMRDLARLEDFLIGKSPRAALAAVRAIRAAVESLKDFPDRGAPVGDGRRRQLVVAYGRDGYVVQDRIDPTMVPIAWAFHSPERRS